MKVALTLPEAYRGSQWIRFLSEVHQSSQSLPYRSAQGNLAPISCGEGMSPAVGVNHFKAFHCGHNYVRQAISLPSSIGVKPGSCWA